MWFCRVMMRVSWPDKKHGDDVLRETGSQRELVTRIVKRQSSFFGQIMRRKKLKCVI